MTLNPLPSPNIFLRAFTGLPRVYLIERIVSTLALLSAEDRCISLCLQIRPWIIEMKSQRSEYFDLPRSSPERTVWSFEFAKIVNTTILVKKTIIIIWLFESLSLGTCVTKIRWSEENCRLSMDKSLEWFQSTRTISKCKPEQVQCANVVQL